jgi:hypothetical protein
MKPWNFDLAKLHGQQEVTDEDRAYRGSRYADVRAALFENPYRDGVSGQKPGPLPMFKSTIANAWRGAFGNGPDFLRQASARVLDSRADLRWGADRKGYRRIIAPNGICVLGSWEITEDTPYSGYFKKGARGLTIARFSSDGNETRRGERRSISLGMKIYPTTDPNHPTPLVPASVIIQEDLGGMHTDYLNDAELRNAPNVTASRRGIFLLIIVHAGMIFQDLDKVADSRQVYEVAELGKPEGEPTRSPQHLLLKMAAGQQRIDGHKLDFRDEIYQHIYKDGSDTPTGSIDFDISVSDNARKSGVTGLSKVIVTDWKRIGRLSFTEAIASYNADHVVQFHHPGWRDNLNDANTAVRAGEQRVR